MRSLSQIHETNDAVPIVILGGGFGGLFTALHLRDLQNSCPIILIDQSWCFVFKPLLYELLSSEVKLERGSEILKESTSDRLGETAKSALKGRNASVEVLLGSEVKEVHPGVVEFERNGQSERLAAATVLWTTGNATHPVIEALSIAAENRDKHNRLLVKPTLQLPEFPEVFAAGDCAIAPSNPQPATAQVAYQQGVAIAHNIKALIALKSPTPATVYLRGTLMKLGLHQSVVEICDRDEIKGQLGQTIRQATYLELIATPARNFVNQTEWFTEEILQQITDV